MIIPIEVAYRDLDAMGHVNNAVYLAYFETARQKYWDRLVGLKSFWDIGFVVAHISIDYRVSASLGDRLEVEIRCPRVGQSSFDFTYEISRGGSLIAEGKSTQVLWDWQRREKKEFSPELRERIAALEAKAEGRGR
jgi:acyl-CoA thioester hydrolase